MNSGKNKALVAGQGSLRNSCCNRLDEDYSDIVNSQQIFPSEEKIRADFLSLSAAELKKQYNVDDDSCGHLQPASEPGTEAFYKEQRIIFVFQGWPVNEIDKHEMRQRKNFADFAEAEAAEQKANQQPRRKIYTPTDLSIFKKQLRRYLELKGVDVNKNIVRCPSHDDKRPSAYLYDKQNSPLVYCPVCGKSFDIFNVSGLINNTSDFKSQLADVRQTLGVR